ncbi:MAG: CHAT domain-containing protein, partial [Bacteroidota bacterium]
FDALRTSSIVHVAAHALVSPASYLQHSILLSPEDPDEDGSVYLFDFIRRDLGTPLVVLTGCATAAGEVSGGEGMAGFQYAFRAAGVGSVVATMWMVDDHAMADVVHAFYQHLAAGFPKDVALQRAQREYIEDVAHLRASPFYWAAPVLYGNPDSLKVPARSVFASPAGGALLLLILTAVGAAISLRSRFRRSNCMNT